jgi:hypothetical protein
MPTKPFRVLRRLNSAKFHNSFRRQDRHGQPVRARVAAEKTSSNDYAHDALVQGTDRQKSGHRQLHPGTTQASKPCERLPAHERMPHDDGRQGRGHRFDQPWSCHPAMVTPAPLHPQARREPLLRLGPDSRSTRHAPPAGRWLAVPHQGRLVRAPHEGWAIACSARRLGYRLPRTTVGHWRAPHDVRPASKRAQPRSSPLSSTDTHLGGSVGAQSRSSAVNSSGASSRSAAAAESRIDCGRLAPGIGMTTGD